MLEMLSCFTSLTGESSNIALVEELKEVMMVVEIVVEMVVEMRTLLRNICPCKAEEEGE